MSIEELQSDALENGLALKALDPLTSSTADIINFLKGTMGPFLFSSVPTELEEIDDSVAELFSRSEDTLQEETAEKFKLVLVSAQGLIGEFEKRLLPADLKIAKAIKEWNAVAAEMLEYIEEITVLPAEDEDEDEDEDDEDGEEGEEGDEDEEDDKKEGK